MTITFKKVPIQQMQEENKHFPLTGENKSTNRIKMEGKKSQEKENPIYINISSSPSFFPLLLPNHSLFSFTKDTCAG